MTERTLDRLIRALPLQSLRLRILTVALLPLLLAVSLFAVYFVQRSVAEAERTLIIQGQSTVRRLGESVAYDVFTGNLQSIRRQFDLERQRLQAPSIALTDTRTWQVISGVPPPVRNTGLVPVAQHRLADAWLFAHRVVHPIDIEPDIFMQEAPPSTLPELYVVLTLSQASIDQTRSQVIQAAAGMALITLLLAMILAWRIACRVSEPLQDITTGVRRISLGELATRVQEDAEGEIRDLQAGVNHMAQALEKNQEELEQRIHNATRELRDQTQAAESATLAKGRFLAAASHDLRQPLHALLLLVEVLRDSVPEGETRRLADLVQDSAHNMESLLKALLDLSRLDANAVQVHAECFPLARIMQNIERQFTPLAAEKGLQLRLRPCSGWVDSDPILVERVLANLVTNAIRYTQSGGVLVGARRQGNSAGEARLRLEVWDTGKGIPEAFHDRIFEEYFQLDNPERQRDKGLGLGLAIVARLAALLGSSVRLLSREGRGSCFAFDIPACAPPAPGDVPSPAVQAVQTAATLRLESALVAFIDDDEVILQAMLELFEGWNIALAVGEDGEQLRDELRALGKKPDLILSDYRLKGGRTGVEAIAILRQAFGPVPAALITGDTAPETIQKITQTGLPILHKPLKPGKLRAFLTHLLASEPEKPEPLS